jgi:uncharacterized membrane protein
LVRIRTRGDAPERRDDAALLGGLIVLVIWAVRQFSGGRPAPEDPTAILKRRLAAGELTEEQYEQARRALQS